MRKIWDSGDSEMNTFAVGPMPTPEPVRCCSLFESSFHISDHGQGTTAGAVSYLVEDQNTTN